VMYLQTHCLRCWPLASWKHSNQRLNILRTGQG
jgi:hypothetical protein